MNRTRRLTAIGVAAAGLIGLVSLTGAASASAATASPGTSPRPSVSASAPSAVTPNPSAPKPKGAVTKAPAPKPGDVAKPKGDRVVARVKAAVVAKYPRLTVTKVSANGDGGWTVAVVTAKGQKGTVAVERHLEVGRLVLAASHHHQG